MALPNDLVSQFAKLLNETVKNDNDDGAVVYGKIVVNEDGQKCVRLDGSNEDTPITREDDLSKTSSMTDIEEGDRVSVTIKNHTATITGNISSPAARNDDVIAIVNRVQANEGYIAKFQADIADIDELRAATAEIGNLTAQNAEIKGTLEAQNAEIGNLKATKIDASVVEAQYATITGRLDAEEAKVYDLEVHFADIDEMVARKIDASEIEAHYMKAEDIKAGYANIDFSNIEMAAVEELFAKSGIINDLVVGDEHITGELVGVTLKGDLIEAGTLKADKIVVKGSDGIFYKLNVEAGGVSAEEAPTESLHGSVIAAKSITAEKVNVKDLVAFGATIGGFHITDNAIFSGVKESVHNTTRGIYQDDDGQFALGDADNFLRYYETEDGSYRLEMSSKGRSVTDLDPVGVVTGNPVRIDDVSPIEHEMKVQLTTERGKNLFDPIYSTHGTTHHQIEMRNSINVVQGAVYVISVDKVFTQLDVYLEFDDGSESKVIAGYNNTMYYFKMSNNAFSYGGNANVGVTKTFDKSIKRFRLFLVGQDSAGWDVEPLVQLEEGTVATEYEPYKPYADFTAMAPKKNLIKYPYYQNSKTLNGVTFTNNEDGSVTVNGTATASVAHFLQCSVGNYTGVYTLSGGINNQLYMQVGMYTDSGSWIKSVNQYGVSKTITCENYRLDICVYVPGGATVDNVTVYPQFEEGPKATEYEPYTLAPAVRVTSEGLPGKNLIDQDAPAQQDVVASSGQGWINEDGAWIGNVAYYLWLSFGPYHLSAGQAITISFECENIGGQGRFLLVTGTQGSGSVLSKVCVLGKNVYTYTATADIDLYACFTDYAKTTENPYIIKDIQLEEGSEATEYEPFIYPTVYYADEDGYVNGITSIYPVTTLTCNNQYATINCEYNKNNTLGNDRSNQTVIEKRMSDITVTNNDISATVSSMKDTYDGYADRINYVEEQTKLLMDDDSLDIRIQKIEDNGVSKVSTTNGYLFDDEGMMVYKDEAPTKTQVTHEGMTVYKKTSEEGFDPILTANDNGVDATNLKATNYIIINEESRLQTYTKNGKKRTACFWIGG